MGYDIYNCPLQDTLNVKIDRLYFLTKMKMINPKFEDDFLYSLFFSITKGYIFIRNPIISLLQL